MYDPSTITAGCIVITFEVLCSEQDGAHMVLFDKVTDLGSHFGSIPSHDQHLADGPIGVLVAI